MVINRNTDNNDMLASLLEDDNLMNDEAISAIYDDGSVEVDLGEDVMDDELFDEDMMEMIEEQEQEMFYANLVDKFSEDELNEIGREVVEAFNSDMAAREEWENVLELGFSNLGLKPTKVTKPFEDACGAYHPLIIENAVKFQSKASNELLPAKGPVRMHILGDVTTEKQERALRKEKHMNWQTTTQMSEYYVDSEKMFLFVALVGSGFKKVYYSSALRRNVSEFVSADQLVVPYGAPDLERASRYTQILYKSEDDYNRDVVEGLYSKEDIGSPTDNSSNITVLRQKQDELLGITPSGNTYDYAYTFLEQHVNMYLKTDKDKGRIAKPYIITVEKESGKVLGIRRNWEFGDLTYTKNQYFVHYQFIPGFGFYGFGLIHLLGNYQLTLTAVMRSLVDAGQLANIKGGFKTGSIRNEKSNLSRPLNMGEWRDIETGGLAIKDALYPMQYGEPSKVLYELLQYLESRGQKFADSTEQVVADSANYGPVGTTLALLDASTKFFSALHKRLHSSQKKELSLLARLNAMYLDEMEEFKLPGKTYKISREDYEDMDTACLPVSDPNIPSRAYLLSINRDKIQFLQQVPALAKEVNMRELARRVFLAMDEENIDELIPPEEEAQRLDPIGDIEAAINGKPIKVFEGQDHDSHVAVKMAWLQDPNNGASPVMQPFAPVIQANIREHMLMKYRTQIQGMQQMSGNVDQAMQERVQAEAAQQILMANQQAQFQGTPEQQIAQAEMIRAQNEQRKQQHTEQRDAANLALNANKQITDLIKEDNRHQETLDEIERKRQSDALKANTELMNRSLQRVNERSENKFTKK